MPTRTWTPDDLERCRHRGDPVADDAVAAVFTDDGEERGRQLLRSVIQEPWPPRHGWPPVIARYLDETAHLPDWLDPDLIEFHIRKHPRHHRAAVMIKKHLAHHAHGAQPALLLIRLSAHQVTHDGSQHN